MTGQSFFLRSYIVSQTQIGKETSGHKYGTILYHKTHQAASTAGRQDAARSWKSKKEVSTHIHTFPKHLWIQLLICYNKAPDFILWSCAVFALAAQGIGAAGNTRSNWDFIEAKWPFDCAIPLRSMRRRCSHGTDGTIYPAPGAQSRRGREWPKALSSRQIFRPAPNGGRLPLLGRVCWQRGKALSGIH